MGTEPQDISEAITTWLHYKSLVGMSGLLNEASMAVPIAEFLSARYGKEVTSEKAHPVLQQKRSIGRPNQIDFVRLKSNESTWHAAYESKFQTKDFAKIMFDICRLVILNQAFANGTPSRYFIYATKTTDSKKILSNSFNSGEGCRQSYFESILNTGKKYLNDPTTFRLKDLHPKQAAVFRSFAKRYKKKLPSSIVTELQGWSKSGNYACAVWRITSAQGASLLSSKELTA